MKKIILLILLSFMSLAGYAQLSESFEGAPAIPDAAGVWALPQSAALGTWLVRDNRTNALPNWRLNVGAPGNPPANSGTNAAFVDRENTGAGVVAEEWLITPQITVLANAQLRFFARQTLAGTQPGDTRYQVRVSSSAVQGDLASFTTILADYDEATLSTLTPDQLDYEEKFINLNITGPRYFAFVKITTQPAAATAGDRWLLDDVRMIERCIDPVTPFTAINITATSATLTWQMPAGSLQTDFEVEYDISGFTQGTGTVVTATSSSFPRNTNISGLIPSTSYQFYVRSVCAASNSEWVGPFNFNTIPLGSVCGAPIVVPSAPYSTTSNTTIYGNNITNGTPGTLCGAGAGFLGGNDVVYSYTVPATTTGLLSITMTPLAGATNTGVFVYNSCPAIGTSCIAGVGNATANVRSISALNVTAGQTILIVISSTTATPTFGYTLIIQDVNCVAPTALALNTPATTTNANLEWTNGIASTSVAWEVVVQTAGAPIPSGSGVMVTGTQNTSYPASSALTPTPGPLTPDTAYEFWVRADCGNGTFSTWSGPFAFTTLPTCPKPTLLAAGPITSGSVAITFTNNSAASTFDVYTVTCGSAAPNAGSVPTGTISGIGAAISGTISGLNPDTCFDIYVRANCGPGDLSTWTGPLSATTQQIPPACGGTYTDLGGSAANYPNNADSTITICPTNPGDKVTVTFTSFNTEANWDGLYVFDGNSIGSPQIASTNGPGNVPGGLAGSYWGAAIPGPFTSTSADGCLTFRFRSDGSFANPGWVADVTCAPPPACPQPTSFTLTTPLAATTATVTFGNPGPAVSFKAIALPCGSPAPTVASPWITTGVNAPSYTFTGLTPDTCYDFYVMSVCGVLGDSTVAGPRTGTTAIAPPICGGTFSDPGGSGANYPNNADSTVTICPTIPGQKVTVTFTSFTTEANWDGLYVYDGNTITAPQISSANGPGNVPGGLPGSFWGTAIPGPFTSTSADGCLTFRFRSDGSFNNPGWVANVTCAEPPTCAIPSGLSIPVPTVTHNQVTFSWLQNPSPDGTTPDEWQVLYLPCGSPAPTAGATGWVGFNALSNTVTGLTPDTCYDFYVRAVCSLTDSSPWAGPITRTTLIAPPICGGVFTDLGGANVNYPNNADSTVTICPTNPGEIVTVTFTSFNTEANWDGLYVFDGNSITAPQIASANGPGNVPGGIPGSYWGTEIPGPFTSTSPDGCLTFRFRSDGSFNNPGWVANVTCSPAPTCLRPSPVTATSISQTNALITWGQPVNPDGTTASAWEVILLPFGAPAPDENTIGGIPTNTPSFNATGLFAGTRYVIYIRAICSATDNSDWSAYNFATPPSNDECTGATFAIVNQNLNCVQTTPGSVIGATASLPAPSCGGADDDVWYTFTATDATHIVSFNNVVPANANLDYAVYTGTSCGTLVQSGACNIADNLTAGVTYYIRVFTAATVAQFVTFDLCIGTLPCTEAPAFCTGQTVTYQNATNVPSLGQIGCLFTSPNPAFFFLQVNQAGPLTYLISQVDNGGVPRDVDYVTWGPFTDLQVACNAVPANPLPGVIPAPTPAQGCPGTLHACSYSAAPTEIVCIPDAQLCEVYVIMITNFSNQAGFVTFTQTNSGGGTTECFPINTFNYPETRYCQNDVDPTPVPAPGAINGTYTSTPGLVIDPVTGVVDLSASTPGAYIVTSTTLTSTGGACDNIPTITTTRTIIITAPADATIVYDAPIYCNSISTPQSPTLTGTATGSYSATPAGLSINSGTGAILPIASAAGIYTITYTVAAEGGCPAFTTTAQVQIIATPLIPFINNVVVCESSYTLPALTVGNYFEQSGGGVPIAVGTVISQNSTIYVYSVDGNCTDERSFTITLGDLVIINRVDVTECASYTLPDDLPAGYGYFSQTGGVGPISGTLTGSQEVFIYGVSGICTTESSFQVTIGSVQVPPQPNLSNCTSVILPNLPANMGYYTQPGGPTGTGTLITDLNIFTSQTVYIYAQSGTCIDEGNFTVTIDNVLNPTFPAVPNPCVGATAPVLPLISDNGVSGTWSPLTVDTTAPGTTIYTFTPDATLPCATVTTLSVTVDAPIIPTFDPIADICLGGVAPLLPLTSTNGILGTWSPALVDTSVAGTTCYTFTPEVSFTCATTAQLCITISSQILPTFAQLANVCQNTIAPVLPLTSQNGVTGTWSGTIDTSVTGTVCYTFTPDVTFACAISTQLCITVDPELTPLFTPLPDICQNSIAPILPLISLNGVAGTWSDVIDTSNIGSVTLTFTPNQGQLCALTTTMTINVIAPLVPDFAPITLCAGQPAPILSGASPNGVTGTWLPLTIDNMLSGTYTFTPNVVCALPQTITVTVDPLLTPDFGPIADICAGATAPVLAGTSPNGILGTWSPATINNTTSGCYIFTPNAGLCAEPQTLCVTVNPSLTPNFAQIAPLCSGETAPALATTSPNGINGTWNPSTIDNFLSGDGDCYVFTPTAGQQCANTQTLCVTVNPNPTFDHTEGCESASYLIRITDAPAGASYSWTHNGVAVNATTPVINLTTLGTGPGTYIASVTEGGCTTTKEIVVNSVSCAIQKGISPKGVGAGDNKNDFFDLAGQNVKKMEIFNRYGTNVYSKVNYSNEWYGQSDKGDELPDGTYYYVIEYNSGSKTVTGWIYINREQ